MSLKVFVILAVLASVGVYSATPISVSLTNFAIVSESAQLTELDGSVFNGGADNVLPSQACGGGFWDAAYDGQPQGVPNWVIFDLLAVNFTVTTFSYASLGDTVHDPLSFTLEYSDFASGPWVFLTATFNGVVGTSAFQLFPVVHTQARFWRWTINTRGTADEFQAVIVHVNFYGLYSAKATQLNNFAINSFNTEYGPDPASNLLPINNPSASPSLFWDPIYPDSTISEPNWIIFDLTSTPGLFVTGFEFASEGDTTHDIQDYELDHAVSPSGPWVSFGAKVATSGSSAVQTLTVKKTSTTASPFWRLYITSTYSQYQPWVTYVNFLVEG